MTRVPLTGLFAMALLFGWSELMHPKAITAESPVNQPDQAPVAPEATM